VAQCRTRVTLHSGLLGSAALDSDGRMRSLSIAIVASLALLVSACTDEAETPDASGGAGGASTGGNAGGAGRSGSAGSAGRGSSAVVFTDLPGKIRFVNHVSDGTTGVDLDLYWGLSIGRGEKQGTIPYGEATEFFTPRHSDEPVLDADEARYFLVPKDDVSRTPASFLAQDDPAFAADTVLTIALAAAKNISGDNLVVAAQTFHEQEIDAPPAGMAHVFGWTSAFEQIADGNFTLVGTDSVCSPERGESDGNIGVPVVLPRGEARLSLFDANTKPPCATGTPLVDATLEAGHSYVLLGKADTYEFDARSAVVLEVGAED